MHLPYRCRGRLVRSFDPETGDRGFETSCHHLLHLLLAGLARPVSRRVAPKWRLGGTQVAPRWQPSGTGHIVYARSECKYFL